MRMLRRLLVLLAFALFVSAPAAAVPSELQTRLQSFAQRGSAEASYHLGMIYHLGLEGVARDYRRALGYFRRAAEGGDPLGAYKLGCYYAGQGDGVVPADAEQALRYKLVAAEAGYVLAQVEVAQSYASRGDRVRAAHWYEAAGRQGDGQALFMALIQVMPGSPNADRPRTWLYVAAIDRMFVQMAPPDLPREESEEMQRAMADMRRMTENGMSESERAEGERLLAAWQVTRTPLSLSADQGLNAARRLVACLQSPDEPRRRGAANNREGPPRSA